MKTRAIRLITGVFFLSAPFSGVYAEEGFVAGLQPDRRPAQAPSIKVFAADASWQDKMNTGIDEPRNGLGFIKDQGAWYTPFNRPNLTGRYDIRGFHAAANAKKD